jgi:hypothetical protein
MTFTFNNAIPASGNNPSVDQPGMLSNNISTANIINVDHVGFNQSSGGKHKVIRARSLQTLGIALPPGVSGEGSIYTRTASAVTNLFYRPDATANEYQLTRTIAASFATFGTDTNYNGNNIGGWTFLPGGLLFQYGFITPVVNQGNTAIVYPVAFSSGPAFSLTVSAVVTSSLGDLTSAIRTGTSGSTGFSISTSSSGNVTSFYWMAIGV